MTTRADVKPFVHWVIYKGYQIRYTLRQPTQVEGKLLTPSGELPFIYVAASREIRLPDAVITINEHGWELTTLDLPTDGDHHPDSAERP